MSYNFVYHKSHTHETRANYHMASFIPITMTYSHIIKKHVSFLYFSLELNTKTYIMFGKLHKFRFFLNIFIFKYKLFIIVCLVKTTFTSYNRVVDTNHNSEHMLMINKAGTLKLK